MKNLNGRTPVEEEKFQRSLPPEKLNYYFRSNAKCYEWRNDVKPCIHEACRCKNCVHVLHNAKYAGCQKLEFIPSGVFFDNKECSEYTPKDVN